MSAHTLGQWLSILTCLGNPETGGGTRQTRPTQPSSGKNIVLLLRVNAGTLVKLCDHTVVIPDKQ